MNYTKRGPFCQIILYLGDFLDYNTMQKEVQTMEIRFAEKKDIPGILELLRQVGKVHHDGRPDLFRPDAQKYDADQVASLLQDALTTIFVAAEGDRLLGYCFCMRKEHKCDSVFEDHASLYIDDLCIDEACRGQGVGKALYQAAVEYAKDCKYYNVTLNVWTGNPGAVAFYEKLGLKPQKIGMEMILEDR